MPSVWSWYHRVVGRWSLGYWKTAEPGSHVWPWRASASALNGSKTVPPVAYPAGMSLAAGRYQASG